MGVICEGQCEFCRFVPFLPVIALTCRGPDGTVLAHAELQICVCGDRS